MEVVKFHLLFCVQDCLHQRPPVNAMVSSIKFQSSQPVFLAQILMLFSHILLFLTSRRFPKDSPIRILDAFLVYKVNKFCQFFLNTVSLNAIFVCYSLASLTQFANFLVHCSCTVEIILVQLVCCSHNSEAGCAEASTLCVCVCVCVCVCGSRGDTSS
jgi:hypothetical protein